MTVFQSELREVTVTAVCSALFVLFREGKSIIQQSGSVTVQHKATRKTSQTKRLKYCEDPNISAAEETDPCVKFYRAGFISGTTSIHQVGRPGEVWFCIEKI
ncbi:hypothetical protein ATANTOWER_025283 [Ataeniobius toweri]|uniref:Uncharacterized protein n=1 Tax=Ataeniobius toweri TaxID=208326 RepID=A0ABU7BS30_9TELE|nr:hypothetical protein [Ataeniobius toweri]